MAKKHNAHKKAVKHRPRKHQKKHAVHHAKRSIHHTRHKAARHAKKTVHHKARKKAHHRKHVPKEPQPFKDVIHTELDEIVFIVDECGRISLKELSRKLSMPLNQVERWCERLAEHGLLKLNYPLIGRTYLVSMQKYEETPKVIVQTPPAPKKVKRKSSIPRNILILILAIILLGIAVFIVLKAARGG